MQQPQGRSKAQGEGSVGTVSGKCTHSWQSLSLSDSERPLHLMEVLCGQACCSRAVQPKGGWTWPDSLGRAGVLTPLGPEDASLACTPRGGHWPWALGMVCPWVKATLLLAQEACPQQPALLGVQGLLPVLSVLSHPVCPVCSSAVNAFRAALVRDSPATEVQTLGESLVLSQELQMLHSLSCVSLLCWHSLPGSVPFPPVKHRQ